MLLPSILPVSRQGSRTSACDPVGARVTGRANVDVAGKARRTVFDGEETLGVEGQRPVDRIDIEAHAQAVVADAAHGDPIGIVHAVGVERALPLHRTGERAQLALELELVEHHAVAARGIGEQCAAVADVEALDRDRLQVEADRRRRPVEAAVAVERDGDLGALEDHVGGLELAARQRPERELDAEPARPQRTGLVAARDARSATGSSRVSAAAGLRSARQYGPAGRSSGWPGSRTGRDTCSSRQNAARPAP